MKPTSPKDVKTRKVRKSRIWIIKDIYFYIIGINLFLFIGYSVLSEIIDFRKSLIVSLILLLISGIGAVFAIKLGVERMFKKITVHPNEFIKICLLVIIIPIIFDALFSAWIIYSNLENFSNIAWYLVPKLLSEFIVTFISGTFYGIVTYFWLRKLSR